MKNTSTIPTPSEKLHPVSINPLIGSYTGVDFVDLRTPQSLNTDDVLERMNPMKLYPAQIIPITSYYHDSGRWISDREIIIKENYGAIEIKVGDELCLKVKSPANGDATSATSYKVLINDREYPLLHFIPETADGGALDDDNHYDALTQMRTLDDILLGTMETPAQAFKRRIEIVEELIPDHDFWTSKPRHSHGFETPQKVIFSDGSWFQGNEVTDNGETQFWAFGNYDTKYDLAWDIVSNARVIIREIKTYTDKYVHNEWHSMYDYLTAENKRRYKLSKQISQ